MRTGVALLLVLTATVLTACAPAGNPETAAGLPAVRDGVLIHISHGADHPHRALMGLTMAGKMAESRDVLIYCDIKGIDLVVKDGQVAGMDPFRSADDLIAGLLDKGVTIMACPSCLQAAGKSEADLKAGIRVADADAFFTFTRGRILTLDY